MAQQQMYFPQLVTGGASQVPVPVLARRGSCTVITYLQVFKQASEP